MVSTFTPNIQLEEPARGDDVGTWDTPVNNNMTLIDLVAGGVASITLNNSNVVLASAQFESKTITFVSTLTGSVSITFPTSFKKSYEIQNLCTGTSAFTITLLTTASGGQAICAPPGEIVDIINDGTNLKYKNMGRIGSYMDYAGGGVPGWVSGCTVPPYLDCNGASFSSATYPVLASIIGPTLPDFRGRSAYYLNEGTGRLTAAGAGINGDVNFASGGNNGVTLTTSMIPAITSFGTNSISVQTVGGGNLAHTLAGLVPIGAVNSGANVVPAALSASWDAVNQMIGSNNITVTTQGTGGGIVQATAPGAVAGIRMIRAG